MTDNYGIESRFVVGIDLGTTNCAVSYVDFETSEEIKLFPLQQLIAAGEVGTCDLLPSFCYIPAGVELTADALKLPWDKNAEYAVGTFAREQGAAVPGRLISSAKSWLAHSGVDRTKGFLPWGGDLDENSAISPIEASTRYLKHIVNAWDAQFGKLKDSEGTPCVLAEQQVILTIPASFDETARELTVKAALNAGLKQPILIEEPMAAFYAWLSTRSESWQNELQKDGKVLIIDVGGGTTDFSLINYDGENTLRRTAAGEHLLLGGDNMDMTLARKIEESWGTKLQPRQWSMLCQECRNAKEKLLAADAPESVTITIQGIGKSLIGGSKSANLTTTIVQEDILNGFFPQVTDRDLPAHRRSGMLSMGLPYAADPAITRQLVQFLRNAPDMVKEDGSLVLPDAVLFNGGSMLPEVLRKRVCEILGSWGDKTIPELEAHNLNTAVAVGASYYGMARLGRGVRVKGGIARSYYLEVNKGSESELLCIMPRDTEEGVERILPQSFQLATNQQVRFPLYSSATRLQDNAGDIIVPDDDVTSMPPLHTILTFGKGEATSLEVNVSSMLNEVGTLDIWCSTKDGHHKFPLSFDLRETTEEQQEVIATVETGKQDEVLELIETAFNGDDTKVLKSLTKSIEKILELKRNDWNAMLLRLIADLMLKNSNWREKSIEHEARWLNLAGFCLRPGFGMPGDEWRIREIWKLWHAGPLHTGDLHVGSEWWIFWRRCAGGLKEGHQEQVAGLIKREIFPKGGSGLTNQKKLNQQQIEMWRCYGALERLSAKNKAKLARMILQNDGQPGDLYWWVLARLLNRKLFHGPENSIVPANQLESMIKDLLNQAVASSRSQFATTAVSQICRMCGIRNLDISEAARAKVVKQLTRLNAPENLIHRVENIQEDSKSLQTKILGDSLPLGLELQQ